MYIGANQHHLNLVKPEYLHSSVKFIEMKI
jgi:hypothetical protein